MQIPIHWSGAMAEGLIPIHWSGVGAEGLGRSDKLQGILMMQGQSGPSTRV